MLEIEFKYALPQHDAKAFLSERGLGDKPPVVKRDTYYRIPRFGEFKPRPIRIREVGDTVYLTVKNKTYVHSGEQNQEHEVVLKGDTAETLKTMFDVAGLVVARQKIKRSWILTHERMQLDLCEVSPLGWFAEFEIVIREEEDSEAAWEQLESWAHSLGFDRFMLEPRSYARLLEEYDLAMSL
jgi:predicted adenylyl cyclase CyaB